jgi:4,5-DOPA dioxygenase extradiol
MISAHWVTRGTWLTAMQYPQTIHDFEHFPPELSAIQYPAPGSPPLALRIKNLIQAQTTQCVLEESEWGLDHGSWSVLKYLFPKAHIPVVQMSLDGSLTEQEHVQIALQLQSLREEGVLIIGSGNVVHNLSQIQWSENPPAAQWAIQFNNFFKSLLPFNQTLDLQTNHLKNLLTWRQTNPDLITAAKLAMPSPEHYLPALYILGVKYPNESCQVITDGIEMASISMLSFGLGLNVR